MPDVELVEPNEEEVTDAQAIFRAWQDGHHDQAVEGVRGWADLGRPWALSLIPWMYMQQGVPEMIKGIPYAKMAAALGMYWPSANLFNSLIGNAAALTDLEPVMDLITSSGPWWAGVDPVAHGWNLIGQGRAAEGLRLMSLRSSIPATSQEWESLAESARGQLAEITGALNGARAAETGVSTAAAAHLEAMEKVRNDLETSAKQADLMVTTVTSGGTEARFQADANRNEEESKAAWGWGLVVLVLAATVAVAPLVLHYWGTGPDYSTGALLGAHAGSTAALAAVAGVLLARARSRDLARQRASDLSTAMGTMITYSGQISDDGERQRFMTTMGQLVLQAHLTTGPQGHQSEESLTGLLALLSVMKPGNPSSST